MYVTHGYVTLPGMPQNRIAELRETRSLTQHAIAERLGVHESTVSRWESGSCAIPDPRKQELAELFGVSVSFLMGWNNAPLVAA